MILVPRSKKNRGLSLKAALSNNRVLKRSRGQQFPFGQSMAVGNQRACGGEEDVVQETHVLVVPGVLQSVVGRVRKTILRWLFEPSSNTRPTAVASRNGTGGFILRLCFWTVWF